MTESTDECIYCNGKVYCPDDDDDGCPTLEVLLANKEDWCLDGCLCLEHVDGTCKIAKCSDSACAYLAIFKNDDGAIVIIRTDKAMCDFLKGTFPCDDADDDDDDDDDD